jgi:hypothetical protein
MADLQAAATRDSLIGRYGAAARWLQSIGTTEWAVGDTVADRRGRRASTV